MIWKASELARRVVANAVKSRDPAALARVQWSRVDAAFPDGVYFGPRDYIVRELTPIVDKALRA